MGAGISIDVSYGFHTPRQWIRPYPTITWFRTEDEYVLRFSVWKAGLDIRLLLWR